MIAEALLALVAAVAWGFSAFLSKLSAERYGPGPTVLAAQVAGLGLAALAVPLFGEGTGDPAVVLPVVALGWLNLTGFVALYRALRVGELALVEPIVSTSPALTVLLAAVVLREALPPGGWAAVGGVLGGILLIALRPRGAAGAPLARGTGWALWTFVTLGLLTFALKLVVPRAGPAFTILLLRLGAVAVLVPLALLGRIPLPRGNPGGPALLPVAIGLLDTGGFILFNVAIAAGNLTVATVLSGLYIVVVLALARGLLRERVRPLQSLGIAVAVAATIALLALLAGAP